MTRDQLTALGVAIAASAAFAVVYAFPPQQYHFYPVCPIYRWTGWLCPGCGATQALHALLHGEVMAAFSLNPIFVVALPVIAMAGTWQAVCVLRNGRFAQLSIGNRHTFAMLAVMLMFGLVRNLT
jgi:Protein of unknown function (DUF2752)